MFWTQGGQVLVWLTWLWIRGCSGFAWSCPQGGSQWCRGGCLWHRTSIWRLSYNKIQYNCHRDFKQIFKYIDSNTNIINLVITKHGETQQTLTWTPRLGNWDIIDGNVSLQSISPHSFNDKLKQKKKFVFSLNLQLMTHTSILSANYEDAYLNKPLFIILSFAHQNLLKFLQRQKKFLSAINFIIKHLECWLWTLHWDSSKVPLASLLAWQLPKRCLYAICRCIDSQGSNGISVHVIPL